MYFVNLKKCIIIAVLIATAGNSFTQEWINRGSHPKDYKMGGDPTEIHKSADPGFLQSIANEINGFGTYMTSIEPKEEYLGKRLRLMAYVKTENVKKYSGLWMRTDGQKQEALTFDNMQNRPIKGSVDWKKYEVVLDIPDSTASISYGLILSGAGKVWFDNVSLEQVGSEVAVTHFNPFGDFINGNYKECLKVPDDGDVYHRFIKYYAFYKLGKVDEAIDYSKVLKTQEKDPWVKNIIGFLQGKISEEVLLSAAHDNDKKLEAEKLCEAHYYVGMQNLLVNKNTAKASDHLKKCLATGQSDFIEYMIAEAELNKINKNKRS